MLARRNELVALATLLALAGCQGMGTPFRPSARVAQERFDIARLHEKDGQLAKADELYRELHGRSREKARVCQRLGVVNTRLGRNEVARQYFEEALSHDADDSEILTDYGYALVMWGDHVRAEQLLVRALELDSQNRRATNNLGIAVAYQGRPDEAFRHFRRVNDEAAAHANLAYVQVQRGEGRLAVERYARALSLNPELPSGRQGLLELAQLEQRHRLNGIDASNIAKRSENDDSTDGVELASNEVESPANEQTEVVSEELVSEEVVKEDLVNEKVASEEVANEDVVSTETLDLEEWTGTDPLPESDAGTPDDVPVAVVADDDWALSEKPVSTDEVVEESGSRVGAAPATGEEDVSTPTDLFAWADFDESSEVTPVEFSDSQPSASSVIRHASDEEVASETVEATEEEPLPAIIRESTWVAEPETRDATTEVSGGSEPMVRWQVLTVRYADHGGKLLALDVMQMATLALTRNEPFEEVVKQYSDDPNASDGGHVDWTPRSELSGAMESALFRLPVGMLSRVIAGEDAYRIVRVTERRNVD